MAYSREIKRKAENLYVVEGLSFRDVAKELDIKQPRTILLWAREDNWKEKRSKINAKATQIAEIRAIEKIAKEKSKYKEENLKITDAYKSAGSIFIKAVLEELNNPETIRDAKKLEQLLEIFSKAERPTTNAIKAQDDMLFGKTTESINVGLNITADDIYVALIRKDPEAIRKIQGN